MIRLPCNLNAAVVGAGVTRGQVHELFEMVTRPYKDLHAGHAELAVVFVHYGGEALDQRFRNIPRSGAICLGEHLSEVAIDAFNLFDIQLPMSRPGDEAGDDGDLRDEIDQGAIGFTIAQTLKRDPCTQREIRGFLPGHRQKQGLCMRARRWLTQ